MNMEIVLTLKILCNKGFCLFQSKENGGLSPQVLEPSGSWKAMSETESRAMALESEP